ncbi:50S ribosomal protein L31 [Mycoplasma sp. CSL10137]|uniref:50S ribosomal protein L31 n=1 Tax=unclassified Mycoplasma TaxID=2683645 RepID=UPI00197B2EC3|nr:MULTISPECIES: 50S ribosomal protein L31 [unclassified Mycoplasma]MBN4083686.1 50S ribosomal protein L31 [Mycoplasma sp. CSL10137]MBN4084682.1 50S ribosomal protein L31 [Mycoplasma sp. CSL10166]MBU4693160.1 50S ribosomal protein L31 [Mycoplasma sp. CSL7491-lung]MCU4706686.1 50S ribosomal protein L31 [Mycoplasma sp. CSL7503-lung]
MKKDLHPAYYEVQVACSTCQKEFTFKSTRKNFTVDVCSNCHAVFTGNKTQIKATGRIDRFNKRLQKSNANK